MAVVEYRSDRGPWGTHVAHARAEHTLSAHVRITRAVALAACTGRVKVGSAQWIGRTTWRAAVTPPFSTVLIDG